MIQEFLRLVKDIIHQQKTIKPQRYQLFPQNSKNSTFYQKIKTFILPHKYKVSHRMTYNRMKASLSPSRRLQKDAVQIEKEKAAAHNHMSGGCFLQSPTNKMFVKII